MPGFPLRPLVLSLALHVGVIAAWLPSLAGDARQVPPAVPLQGVLLPPAPQEAAAAVAKAPAVPPAPTLHKPVAAVPRQESPPLAAAVQAAVAPEAISVTQLAPAAGGLPRESGEKVNVAVMDKPLLPAGPDQAGLRQYRVALAGEAKRLRRYPEAARRDELAGMVEVRLAVGAGGMLQHAEVNRSSGHAILDNAAVELFRMAAGRTELPSSLRGQSFAVLLPVFYELED